MAEPERRQREPSRDFFRPSVRPVSRMACRSTHPLRRVSTIFWLSLPVVLTGCSSGKPANDTAVGPSANSGPTSVASAATAATDTSEPRSESEGVTLRTADTQLFQQVLQQHQGQVVLVDFWATWCISCKKNFPKIVGYGAKYKDAGLTIVSVSIDDPAAQEEALRFLKSIKANHINLISKWGAGTESAERFDFSGEVPFYRLYDRQGQLKYEFSANAQSTRNMEPLEQIETRIQELLHEPAS